MKHIKLLSALTLSASLLTVASGAVSAAVVTSPSNTAIEKTTGGAGFAVDKTTPIVPELPPSKGGGTDSKNPGDKTTPDGGGTLPSASDLALYYAPKEFNFGVQKVSASDKLKGVTMTQKKWLAGNNDPKPGGLPKWIFIAICGLLAIILLLLFLFIILGKRRKKEKEKA
jgi:hypothetical protein